MGDEKRDGHANSVNKTQTSRRGFLGAAAGVATGGLLKPVSVLGQTKPRASGATGQARAVQVPKAVHESLEAPARRAAFSAANPITGAQVFANLCKDEGLAALFCAPGDDPIIDELAEVGIPCYGGRTESAMTAAADGFSRVTGEVTACSGTEGPGFSKMLLDIAAAHFANTPLLVIASNKNLSSEDIQRDTQFMYQQPLTQGLRKYGKRITVPRRIYEYGSSAFRNLKSGLPDVAHLDFPTEVATARFTDPSQLDCYVPKEQYRVESRAYPPSKDVQRAIDMINRAERPLLVAGHGIFFRKAWEPLMKAAEKNEFAVVGSGPMRGHFPDDHRLSGSMATSALMSADLVVFVGQYYMPNPGEWALPLGVKTIRVHPVPSEIGRNSPIDLGIVSDEGLFMEALADGIPQKKRDAWVAELAAARQKFDQQNLEYYDLGLKHSRDTNTLHPAVIGKEVHDFFYKGKIDPKQTVSGFGGFTMQSYAGRWLRAYRPAQEVPTLYSFGAMGPDFAMMVGATAAVQRGLGPQSAYAGSPVVVITGDAGLGYGILELDTAVKYKLPIICIAYSNDCWGINLQQPTTPRGLHLYLFQEKLRYDKVAEGAGARGEYVRTPEELRAALQRAYDAGVKDKMPTLITAQGTRDFSVGRVYPPGLAFLPDPSTGSFRH